MSWWCHWQRQCKAGAYRKNGCDDTLLLTLCCGFLGLFFNCSVLYPRPPWPISCTMCSWWCFRADNIGAETLLHSLNSGGLLEENCSASFISALSFSSSFLGCEVFFCGWVQAKNLYPQLPSLASLLTCWVQVSQFIRMNQCAL